MDPLEVIELLIAKGVDTKCDNGELRTWYANPDTDMSEKLDKICAILLRYCQHQYHKRLTLTKCALLEDVDAAQKLITFYVHHKLRTYGYLFRMLTYYSDDLATFYVRQKFESSDNDLYELYAEDDDVDMSDLWAAYGDM